MREKMCEARELSVMREIVLHQQPVDLYEEGGGGKVRRVIEDVRKGWTYTYMYMYIQATDPCELYQSEDFTMSDRYYHVALPWNTTQLWYKYIHMHMYIQCKYILTH